MAPAGSTGTGNGTVNYSVTPAVTAGDDRLDVDYASQLHGGCGGEVQIGPAPSAAK
jgi:hypothetical protein